MKLYRNSDLRPVPDPTVLTNQAVTQAAETMRRELVAAVAILSARLDGMDQARQLLVTNTEEIHLDSVRQINQLKELLETLFGERFRSIELQINERDVRVEKTAKDSKDALDAAFQAAKEAVGKQNESFSLATAKNEASTTKQIDQQGVLITTTTAALNDKIDDLKGRLLLIEGRTAGITTATHNQQTAQVTQTTTSTLTAFIALTSLTIIVAIVSLAVAIFKP